MERTSETREQLILEAVADAQEHGRDVVSAAQAAVPDLPGDLYMEALASLEDDGFLQVATIRDGAGRLHGAHVQRLTPKKAAAKWANGRATMSSPNCLQAFRGRSTPNRTQWKAVDWNACAMQRAKCRKASSPLW